MSPTLYLAPMQEVTHLPFWRALVPRGGADVYVTEYFRVHPASKPEPWILKSITENPTGRPVLAQMIGNDPQRLAQTARKLQAFDVAGIDLNLGCPAPTVCGKNCGGGLLQNLPRIRCIVDALRPLVTGQLTLKTRVGFESVDEFAELLDLFADLPIDGLAIHGRTVKEKYQSLVHTREIAQAVTRMSCPVIANGSIVSVESAQGMLQKTGAEGLMIGRGAIRNPWLFTQIRQATCGEMILRPTRADQYDYVMHLFELIGTAIPDYQALRHVSQMKRFMNYIAAGMEEGRFLYEIQRVKNPSEFDRVCRRYLNGNDPMPAEPAENSKLFCGFRELAEMGVEV